LNLLEIFLGGLGGAIISAIVTIYIHRKTNKHIPKGKAYKLLKELGKILKLVDGDFIFIKSGKDNYMVANHIYSKADCEIIATAFHEDPARYGDMDLVKAFKYGGSLFKRITCEQVCNKNSQKIAASNLSKILPGSEFVVIPKEVRCTKIDGIFCKFNDDTYLTFIAFRDPEGIEENKGVIFRDGVADKFYEYYKSLACKYKC